MRVGGSSAFPFIRTRLSFSSSESDETGVRVRAVFRRGADPDVVAAVGFLRSTLESDEVESESLVSDTVIALWGDQAIVNNSESVAISIDIDVSRGRWETGMARSGELYRTTTLDGDRHCGSSFDPTKPCLSKEATGSDGPVTRPPWSKQQTSLHVLVPYADHSDRSSLTSEAESSCNCQRMLRMIRSSIIALTCPKKANAFDLSSPLSLFFEAFGVLCASPPRPSGLRR